MRPLFLMALCGIFAVTPARSSEENTSSSRSDPVQMQQLSALRQSAALTPLSGPGIVVEVRDKIAATRDKTALVTGVVRDYDIAAVVNELRAGGAEGIAVNGVRVTNYSAIRCVGPMIYVGKRAVSHPYRIEAIGNSNRLLGVLTVRGGLIEGLRGIGLSARISRAKSLRLTAASATPAFQFGK